MKRRSFLTSAAALGTGLLAAPRLSLAADAKVLRFIPQANLSSLDAVAGTQYVVRNAAMLVWDTLYGVNSQLEPKPQMAESAEVSDNGNTWTFKLRPGLMFHDGTKVLPKDIIASLKRWMVRDSMGQIIAAQLVGMDGPDDRTFRIHMNKPFSKMLFAVGKANSPMALIMPERIASTDPFKLITEYVGSGPMKFASSEWVPGSKAVFTKFEGYKPRDEAPDWSAGGKHMFFDRVEWTIIPDPATAAGALQSGEVDWWENPIPDLVPLLKSNKNLNVDIADPLGNIGDMRFNHLNPPFNDVRVRRAVMMALNQADFMRAVVGDDPALWKPCPSYFTPGTPAYTAQGGAILEGPRNYDAAKALLKEAGYNGEKIVMLVPTDIAITKAEGDVAADMLKRIGMNVDYQALDWGTVGARRAKKSPVADGGWNIFFTWHAGADCINPAPYTALLANGDKAWFGWPKSDAVQAGIADWYAAADATAEKAALVKTNIAAFEDVVYAPTGFFLNYQSWNKKLSGIVKAPFPVFWGVQKA
jgi:peptide/nickel transport system substrate-binding protein